MIQCRGAKKKPRGHLSVRRFSVVALLITEQLSHLFGPSGPGCIGGHYFHVQCVYVTRKQKYGTTLHEPWWVTKFARLVQIFYPLGRAGKNKFQVNLKFSVRKEPFGQLLSPACSNIRLILKSWD